MRSFVFRSRYISLNIDFMVVSGVEDADWTMFASF